MGSRLFLLCRRLRKGSRFLRGARVYRRAAAAAFAAGLSVSRGPRLSGQCGTSGLPVGVQHAIAFGTHAAEPAVSVFFAPLRRRVSSYGTVTHARFLRLLRRAATRSPICKCPQERRLQGASLRGVHNWNLKKPKFGYIRRPEVGCSARRYPCPPRKGNFGISLLYWLFAREWRYRPAP